MPFVFGEVDVKDKTPALDGCLAQGGFDVTTASTTAVAGRASRAYLQIENVSDTDVWLALDITAGGGTPAAVVNSSICLKANGGAWSEAYTGAVRAIHGSTGTKRITYVEW